MKKGLLSTREIFTILRNNVDGFLDTIPNLDDWLFTIGTGLDGVVVEMRMEHLKCVDDEPYIFWLGFDYRDWQNRWVLYTCVDGEASDAYAYINDDGTIAKKTDGDIVAPFTAEFLDKLISEIDTILKNRRAVDLMKSND